MADFDCKFSEDILGGLLGTNVGEICETALNEAALILENSMKKAAKSTILHEGESEMVNSITAYKARKTKDGSAYVANVGPRGQSTHVYYDKRSKKKRKGKVSNALKAIWKEYGIAGKQAPRPFIGKAVRESEEKVIEKLQETYNKMIGDG